MLIMSRSGACIIRIIAEFSHRKSQIHLAVHDDEVVCLVGHSRLATDFSEVFDSWAVVSLYRELTVFSPLFPQFSSVESLIDLGSSYPFFLV